MMNAEERNKILESLVLMRKRFQKGKIEQDDITALQVDVMLLSDLSYQQLQAAILKLWSTTTFFPTTAEIRRAADEMTAFAKHEHKLSAGEAWEEAIRFAKARSPYDDRPFQWSCPEVKEAVRRFGRNSLWDLETKNEGTARAQFRDIFNDVCAANRDRKIMEVTAGKMGQSISALLKQVAAKKALPE